MKNILVPVDLSGATVRVCNAAADLARAVDGRLTILHVIPPPPVIVSNAYAFDPSVLKGYYRSSRKAVAHKLQALQHWFNKRCSQTAMKLHDGAPVSVILRSAAALKADYIVIGSHGHTAAYDLLVGGTTHGVLRKAKCPVVVVPIAKPVRGRR